jgi:hypothetical protein
MMDEICSCSGSGLRSLPARSGEEVRSVSRMIFPVMDGKTWPLAWLDIALERILLSETI